MKCLQEYKLWPILQNITLIKAYHTKIVSCNGGSISRLPTWSYRHRILNLLEIHKKQTRHLHRPSARLEFFFY
jgi:hypothetical protein